MDNISQEHVNIQVNSTKKLSKNKSSDLYNYNAYEHFRMIRSNKKYKNIFNFKQTINNIHR
jgi:hypothetical protein